MNIHVPPHQRLINVVTVVVMFRSMYLTVYGPAHDGFHDRPIRHLVIADVLMLNKNIVDTCSMVFLVRSYLQLTDETMKQLSPTLCDGPM